MENLRRHVLYLSVVQDILANVKKLVFFQKASNNDVNCNCSGLERARPKIPNKMHKFKRVKSYILDPMLILWALMIVDIHMISVVFFNPHLLYSYVFFLGVGNYDQYIQTSHFYDKAVDNPFVYNSKRIFEIQSNLKFASKDDVWFSSIKLGDIHDRIYGDWNTAHRYYQKAIDINPLRPDGHYYIGRYLRTHDQVNLAYVYLRAAVSMDVPRNSSYYWDFLHDCLLHLELGRSAALKREKAMHEQGDNISQNSQNASEPRVSSLDAERAGLDIIDTIFVHHFLEKAKCPPNIAEEIEDIKALMAESLRELLPNNELAAELAAVIKTSSLAEDTGVDNESHCKNNPTLVKALSDSLGSLGIDIGGKDVVSESSGENLNQHEKAHDVEMHLRSFFEEIVKKTLHDEDKKNNSNKHSRDRIDATKTNKLPPSKGQSKNNDNKKSNNRDNSSSSSNGANNNKKITCQQEALKAVQQLIEFVSIDNKELLEEKLSYMILDQTHLNKGRSWLVKANLYEPLRLQIELLETRSQLSSVLGSSTGDACDELMLGALETYNSFFSSLTIHLKRVLAEDFLASWVLANTKALQTYSSCCAKPT